MPHRKNGHREENVPLGVNRPGEEGGPVAFENPATLSRQRTPRLETRRPSRKRTASGNIVQRHPAMVWGMAAGLLMVGWVTWRLKDKFLKT